MNNKRLKVCIDLDSTLSNFGERTIEVFNEKYNTNYKLEDVKSWDMAKWLDCKPEQLYELWDSDFFLSVEPKEYAKQLFEDLRDMNMHPFVVTAYHSSICIAKTQWLGKYIGLSEKDIIFCNNKHLIDADFRVDDRIRNFLDEDMEIIQDCEHIVFSMPYNLEGIENGYKLNGYYRVNNLREISEIMQNFKE